MNVRTYKTILDPDVQVIQNRGMIVIEDRQGRPIMVAVEHSEGGQCGYCLAHAGEDDFQRILQNIGYNKVWIKSELDMITSPAQLNKLPNLVR